VVCSYIGLIFLGLPGLRLTAGYYFSWFSGVLNLFYDSIGSFSVRVEMRSGLGFLPAFFLRLFWISK
jgi:hypothetical protein